MNKSAYNGKRILHVDGNHVTHTGIIVGESEDGKTTYIRSDNPFRRASRAEYDFQVASRLIPIMLKNASNNPPS